MNQIDPLDENNNKLGNNSAPVILIVEDELLIARDLSQKLKKMGYQIMASVASGKLALDAISAHPPDLVLMDIVIKGDRDGIDIAREIHETFGIPVIFLTAYTDDQTLQRAADSGAYGYVLKPCNERELHATITLVLQKVAEKKSLFELATLDSLTQLYSRRYFDMRLAEEIRRIDRHGGQLSLLIIDIDHFKQINDTYGHPQGDRVLRELAQLFQHNLRQGIDIPCRYGGEEFVVILPETNFKGAQEVAERLRGRCAAYPFSGQSQPLTVTFSGGVVTLDSQPEMPNSIAPHHSGEDLLRQADRMLYRAKLEGRNQICAALLD